MTIETAAATEVGSYFISNYPPFSLWSRDKVPEIRTALAAEPDRSVPMGLYLHIPFCRKRCKFCYFRVYTNQNANAIARYAEALAKEVEIVSRERGVQGRDLKFVYFGGGTPSYLSSKQLRFLRDELSRSVSWDHADEVTFECEPGTLSQEKIQTLKDIGVTRTLSDGDTLNQKKVWIYQPSLGAGVKIKNVVIDYAYANLANQSNPLYTHVFSLKFILVKKEKTTSK